MQTPIKIDKSLTVLRKAVMQVSQKHGKEHAVTTRDFMSNQVRWIA